MSKDYDMKSINSYDFIDDLLDADPKDPFDFGNKVEETLEPETQRILDDMLLPPDYYQEI
jgi:hypothetical protein